MVNDYRRARRQAGAGSVAWEKRIVLVLAMVVSDGERK